MLKKYLISFRGRRRYAEVHWDGTPSNAECCRNDRERAAAEKPGAAYPGRPFHLSLRQFLGAPWRPGRPPARLPPRPPPTVECTSDSEEVKGTNGDDVID